MILGVLDSDDKLHITALEIMAKAYKKYPEYGFIYSTFWKCDSELKNPQVYDQFTKQVDSKKTNLLERVVAHFKTFRKEIYNKSQGFDPKKFASVDGDIILKLEE